MWRKVQKSVNLRGGEPRTVTRLRKILDRVGKIRFTVVSLKVYFCITIY